MSAEPLQRQRGHKLLPDDIRRRLPPLRSADGQGQKAIAQVKLFAPRSRYTLYVTEASAVMDGYERRLSDCAVDDGWVEDVHLYGWCCSPLGPDCDEWGYSSLNELASAAWRDGLPMVERDCYWKPRTVFAALGERGLQ